MAPTNKLPPIRERVTVGALVLDTAAPGWATGLDPEQVSVDPLSTRISIAWYVRDGYAVELTQPVGHGICLSLADFDNSDARDPRAVLLDAWRHEITRRQQQPTTATGGGRR